MSQASGQATADARVLGQKERERGQGAPAADSSPPDSSLEGHRSLKDSVLSEEPLFGTDKYRRAVPLFRPEQLKA